MMLAAIFALFFIGGPLVFRLLTRARPTSRRIRSLALLMALAAGSALAMRYGLPTGTMDPLYLTIGIIVFVWLAWIAALALGAQSLCRSDPSPGMRRGTQIAGMISATVPWFGLAAADMVGF